MQRKTLLEKTIRETDEMLQIQLKILSKLIQMKELLEKELKRST